MTRVVVDQDNLNQAGGGSGSMSGSGARCKRLCAQQTLLSIVILSTAQHWPTRSCSHGRPVETMQAGARHAEAGLQMTL